MQEEALVHCGIPAAGTAEDESAGWRKRLGWQEESSGACGELCFASVTGLWVVVSKRSILQAASHRVPPQFQRSTAEFAGKLNTHGCKWRSVKQCVEQT